MYFLIADSVVSLVNSQDSGFLRELLTFFFPPHIFFPTPVCAHYCLIPPACFKYHFIVLTALVSTLHCILSNLKIV